MQNDATTSISVADMNKIIELSEHKPEIIDFTKLASAPAEEKKEAPAAKKGPAKGNKKDEGKIEDAK